MSFRTAREKAGLTVADVKNSIGVTDAAVYMWETGKMLPTAKRLPKIAELYGCTIEELLSQEEK